MNVEGGLYKGIVLGAGGRSIVDEEIGHTNDDCWQFQVLPKNQQIVGVYGYLSKNGGDIRKLGFITQRKRRIINPADVKPPVEEVRVPFTTYMKVSLE